MGKNLQLNQERGIVKLGSEVDLKEIVELWCNLTTPEEIKNAVRSWVNGEFYE